MVKQKRVKPFPLKDEPRYRVFESVDNILPFVGVGIYGTPSYVEYQGISKSDTLRDVVNHNYKQRVAAGEIFNNPCYRVTRSFEETPGSYVYQHKITGKTGSYNGSVLGRMKAVGVASDTLPTVHLPYDSIVNNAMLAALADVDSSQFNFGEDLAEISKTISSLKGIATDLIDVATSFQRGVWRAGVRELRGKTALDSAIKSHDAVAKAWLKARYEYRPLVISLGDLLSVYWGALDAMSNKVRGRATGTAEGQDSASGSYILNVGHLIDVDYVVQHHYKARGFILYTSDIKNTVSRQLGLGMKDLIPTLWAVTPYSFLIDRFLNVTDLIRAAQNAFDTRIKVLASGVSTSYSYVTSEEITGVTPMKDWRFLSISGRQDTEFRTHWRTPKPINQFLHLPQVNLEQDWETVADLYTIFGKKLRWWK